MRGPLLDWNAVRLSKNMEEREAPCIWTRSLAGSEIGSMWIESKAIENSKVGQKVGQTPMRKAVAYLEVENMGCVGPISRKKRR
jgi:hypothetical protein